LKVGLEGDADGGAVCSDHCRLKWLINKGVTATGLRGHNLALLMAYLCAVLVYTVGTYDTSMSVDRFNDIMAAVLPVSVVGATPPFMVSDSASSMNHPVNSALKPQCCFCKTALDFLARQVCIFYVCNVGYL
jgi:hypothetical protein